MSYELQDKVVLITGAAGGIGAATARALYDRGARVVLTDLRLTDVEALASTFEADRVLALTLDVTDMAASKQVVADTVARFGRLDIVFANAGIAWTQPATTLVVDEAQFERIVEINLLGVWRTVRAALPEIARNQGQVLATSSIYAFLNGTINAPYAMSKAGVEAFMRALRSELAGTGATASTLYPGWVRTPMTRVAFGGDETVTRLIEALLPGPLRALVTPESIAQDVVRGLERRQARIISPARWTAVSLLRGVVNAVFDGKLDRDTRIQGLIRQVEQAAAAVTEARPKKRRGR